VLALEEERMNNMEPESIYKDICQNIRETDVISFKLLNLVPLSSTLGAGILALFQKNALPENTSRPALLSGIVFLSLAGSAIVFGLYKWEQMNIQKCRWLIRRAAKLEKEEALQYKGWLEQSASLGKSSAESLIYRTSILIWLIPIAMLLITYFDRKLG
jgi:hypothetical protein